MASLPSSRSLVAAALMAPNVRATGPGGTSGSDGALVIAGAQSFDSLYLLNGVAITENVRGQPLSPFIEDAIQSTTVSTRRHFGGVRALWRRRRQSAHQIRRQSFQWLVPAVARERRLAGDTPFHETKLDDTIPTHEFTIGGPVFRDQLWFFAAGRFRETPGVTANRRHAAVLSAARQREALRVQAHRTRRCNGQTVRGSVHEDRPEDHQQQLPEHRWTCRACSISRSRRTCFRSITTACSANLAHGGRAVFAPQPGDRIQRRRRHRLDQRLAADRSRSTRKWHDSGTGRRRSASARWTSATTTRPC